MKKEDYIFTDKTGYKIHVVALIPNKPKRLVFIPPLVGATGAWAITTFRYFFREGCILMSFDYCGHYRGTDNEFSIGGTFKDTEVALLHALESAFKEKMPIHVVGTCYALIPLLHVLQRLKWDSGVKSMFSVNGLLNMDELLKFEEYNVYLQKRGMIFKDKTEFIEYISKNKKEVFDNKKLYVEAITEYFLEVFPELADIISERCFGVLDYANVKLYESLHEFIAFDLPKVYVPKHFPCLFFFGAQDTTLSLENKERQEEYLNSIRETAKHAQICNIKIDHFGKGEDHYAIGERGMQFLIESE